MSGTLTRAELHHYLQQVGEALSDSATLFLIGGAALRLLGSPRPTLDVDYVGSDLPGPADELSQVLQRVAHETRTEIEAVPLLEFLPLPEGANGRHLLVGQFSRLTVYLFDPYSIALSKVDRGFESDLEDVLFLLQQGVIQWSELEAFAHTLLTQAAAWRIDPTGFRAHLSELQRSWQRR